MAQKVIRDNDFGGIMMIPLFSDWGIRRCNAEGCTNEPNTIIVNTDHPQLVEICGGHYGMCEEHYQAGNVEGGVNMQLVFDDFDAFKARGE